MTIPGISRRKASSVSGAQMKQLIGMLVLVAVGALLADQLIVFGYLWYYMGRIGIIVMLLFGLFIMQQYTTMKCAGFQYRFGPMTIWWNPTKSIRVYNCVVDSDLIATPTVASKNPGGREHRFYVYRMIFDKYMEDGKRKIAAFNRFYALMPCTKDLAFQEEAHTAFEYDGVPCKVKSCAPVFHMLRPSGLRGDPIPLVWYSEGPYYVTRTHRSVKLLEPEVEDIERAQREIDKTLSVPLAIELAGVRDERDHMLRMEPEREREIERKIALRKRRYGDIEYIPTGVGKIFRNKWLWLGVIGIIAIVALAILFFPQHFPFLYGGGQTTMQTTTGPATTTTATTQYFTETTVTLP